MIRTVYGFNLLELIVSLAVISALALITLPSVVSTIKTHRLAATAEKLYNDLQYARSEAVKTNSTIYVSFQTGDSWCYGINSGSACNCSVASNCNLGSGRPPASQTTSLSVSSGYSSGLQFEGTRGAANSSGTITFTLYGQTTTKTITIGRLGGLQLS